MKVQNIKELYLGYYGRAADIGGLNYWIDQAKAGMSIQTMAKHFADAAESKALYPWLKNGGTPSAADAQAFVTSIYSKALAREPDAGGLAYWSGQLSSGAVTADQIVLNVIQGAHLDILNDLPATEWLIYGNEIRAATGLNNGVAYVNQTKADVNSWFTTFTNYSNESEYNQGVYNAKHSINATDFNQYYNAMTPAQQAMIMTDAQEAVIDVQLVGITPTF